VDVTSLNRTLWRLLTQNRRSLRRRQADFLRAIGPGRVLEVGSGQRRRGVAFQSAVDLAPPECEFVMTDVDPANGHRLLDVTRPEPSWGEFDAILCCNVLEHVFDLEAALKGLRSLVREDGHVFASTPFVYPLHDEPTDFWRPTQHALRELFERHWTDVSVEVSGLRRFPFQVFVTAHGRTPDRIGA